MGRSRAEVEHFDAIIVGAGIAGLYFHYKLNSMGWKVKGFEAGSGVGGTWYWNRYPGARFDSESYSYGYSFSQELLQDWEWKEHFSAQPENERYLNYVADKFDLRRNIQFESRLLSATYRPHSTDWEVATESGDVATARFLLCATGILSAPFVPEIPGVDRYQGQSWHTSLWPKEAVDLSRKKVAVIGTGATAVQLITEIAKDIGHLTVFQRTPNYCGPLHNGVITVEEQKAIKASYSEIFKKCRSSFGGFLHDFDSRSIFDVKEDEREAFFEAKWDERGFAFWLGSFSDILTNQEANDIVSEFVRKKIKERVNDPTVAELLAPKCHGFGTKRQPMESGYYEVYNQENVVLVDLKTTPIKSFTESGIKTSDKEFDFDIVIYATGFDAVTGALNRINIRGESGATLKQKWSSGPSTYLGMATNDFPNMFIAGGPHNSSSFCNVPRCLEQNVEWITDCLDYMENKGFSRIEAKKDAERFWTKFVLDSADATLLTKTKNWFMGDNVPGKKRVFLNYVGGVPLFRQHCDDSAAKDYEGFELT